MYFHFPLQYLFPGVLLLSQCVSLFQIKYEIHFSLSLEVGSMYLPTTNTNFQINDGGVGSIQRPASGVDGRPKTSKSRERGDLALQQAQPCPREGASLRSFFQPHTQNAVGSTLDNTQKCNIHKVRSTAHTQKTNCLKKKTTIQFSSQSNAIHRHTRQRHNEQESTHNTVNKQGAKIAQAFYNLTNRIRKQKAELEHKIDIAIRQEN